MAVRFLPIPGEPVPEPPQRREEREDLAEVISLRSRLPQRGWGEGGRGGADAGGEHAAFGGTEEPEASETFEGPEASDASEVVEGPTAVEDGVRVLARRARSSGELRRELLRRGHDAAEVEQVVAEFEESLYLDDTGLARIAAEKLRDSKGASKGQISRKLRERMFPDHVIEEVVDELDDDEEDELLRDAAGERARRLTGLDRQTAERRLLGFLARRGWGGEPAVRAAREALDTAGVTAGGLSAGGARGQGSPGSGGVRFR